MAKSPTFNVNDPAFQTILAQAMAAAMAGKTKASGKAPKAGSTDKSAANDAECIRVFSKAGFKDCQPRVNILTFRKWVEQGRRPIEGTKSLKVGQFRLFHSSQVRELTPEDIAKMAQQKADFEARKAGTNIVPLNAGSDQ